MLISFNFEVHQPHRLKKNINNDILLSKIKKHSLENNYDYDDVVNLWNRYVDVTLNKEIFNKVAEKCYIPTNRLFLELIDEYDIKLAYSITGVFLEQAMEFNDEVIDLFKDLVKTGNVELIGETYHHSLSSLFSTDEEFREDILRHRKLIKDLFNYKTKVFRNTELIYHNSIAKTVKDIGGFNGIFTEGADKLLGWRSPNYVYNSTSNLKVLLRNYRLSDDIGFRFSCCNWEEYPLTADKYAKWLANEKGDCINLYVDYETFGEHQWKETGIFEFLKYMPYEIEKYANLKFAKPSEILEKHSSVGEIDVFEYNPISWADIERDISAWYGNKMQRISFEKLKSLKKPLEIYIKNNIKYNIKRNNNSNNYNGNSSNNGNNSNNITKYNNDENNNNFNENVEELDLYNIFMEYRIYKNLQTSDNLYYQCTKGFDDMAVHSYFSHFETPYDAFITYNDIINDLKTYLLLSQVISLYSKRMDKLKNKLNNLVEKCPKYIEDNKKLNMEVEKLNKIINKLYDELEKINKKHLITINNKKYEIEQLNSEILKLEKTIVFLKEKNKEIEQIKEEKDNLNKMIRELQKDKAQLIEKLNNEKKEKIKINEMLLETKKKLEDIEFKVISKENSYHKEIEKLNNDVNNLKNELDSKIEIIKKLKNEKIMLEENIIELKKEIKLNNSKLNETIKNLESNLEFKDKHIKDINSEISKLNTIIANLKKNYNDLQKDIHHKEENIRILNNERIKLLNKLKKLDSNYSSSKNNEDDKNDENKTKIKKDNKDNNNKNKDNNNPKKKDLLEKAFGDLIIGS